MTKIFGYIAVKDEADRYLADCLKHNISNFDDVFAWDDRSEDSTARICRLHGCTTVVRPEGVPSFLEHEGQFRFAGWKAFEEKMSPSEGDWILSFDADEFLVLDKPGPVRLALEKAITRAQQRGQNGVILPFPEVFDVVNGVPQVRMDGLWGQVRGPRLFVYRGGAEWSDKPMGCGSEPTYVVKGPLSKDNCGLTMLHYGYADKADQVAKHARYTSLFDHGHNDRHVQSIISPPTLQRWTGQVPVTRFSTP